MSLVGLNRASARIDCSRGMLQPILHEDPPQQLEPLLESDCLQEREPLPECPAGLDQPLACRHVVQSAGGTDAGGVWSAPVSEDAP